MAEHQPLPGLPLPNISGVQVPLPPPGEPWLPLSSLLPSSKMAPDAHRRPQGTAELALDSKLLIATTAAAIVPLSVPLLVPTPLLVLSPVLMLSLFLALALSLGLVRSLLLAVLLSLTLVLLLALYCHCHQHCPCYQCCYCPFTPCWRSPHTGTRADLFSSCTSLVGGLGTSEPLSGLKLLLCGTGCSGCLEVPGGHGRATGGQHMQCGGSL